VPLSPTSGSGYQPPSSPAYTSATKLPPPRAAAVAPGATGAPPPAPAPAAHLSSTGGGRRGWIIAAVVLVIALVAGGAAFMLLGDDDSDDDGAAPSSEETTGTDDTPDPGTSGAPDTDLAEPVDVAQAFFTAAAAGDCPAMTALLTEGSLLIENDSVEAGLADCEQSVAEGDTGFEGMVVANVSLVSVDGDLAIVSVDFDIDGQASTEQFHLQRVDGEWKVDLEASA